MDGKAFFLLFLGILVGLFVISRPKVRGLLDSVVPPTPGTFDPVGDDGLNALTIAAVATGTAMALKSAKVA
jgi:hypothetical protein